MSSPQFRYDHPDPQTIQEEEANVTSAVQQTGHMAGELAAEQEDVKAKLSELQRRAK